jgi:hypothetical protein
MQLLLIFLVIAGGMGYPWKPDYSGRLPVR